MPNDQIIMTTQQVRKFDRHAIEHLKIPGIVLMENAGINCTNIIIQQIKILNGRKVSIFAGTGNNGGDGYVIARHLENYGYDVNVLIVGDTGKIKADALINFNIIKEMNLKITAIDPQNIDAQKLKSLCSQDTLIIDAVFGTGLKGQLKPQYINLFNCINSLKKYTISIDAPSGLDCDTGTPLTTAIKADHTITLAAMKKGFLNPDAKKYTGQITVKPIGISLKFSPQKPK